MQSNREGKKRVMARKGGRFGKRESMCTPKCVKGYKELQHQGGRKLQCQGEKKRALMPKRKIEDFKARERESFNGKEGESDG